MKDNYKFLGIALLLLIVLYGVFLSFSPETNDLREYESEYKTFSSCEQMESYLNDTENYNYYSPLGLGGMRTLGGDMATQAIAESATGAAPKASDYVDYGSTDYSETNIQVEGVDEADIVKTDGKYIYVLSNQKLSIIDAYPAEDGEVVSEIKFEKTPQDIFVNGDKLVVFGSSYSYNYLRPIPMIEEAGADATSNSEKKYSGPTTFIRIYDIEDREEPEMLKNITAEGNYFQSRMIGNYVYAIVDKPTYGNPEIPILYEDGLARAACNCGEVGYFNIPDSSYKFTTIFSMNLENQDVESEVYLMGYSNNLYVSQNNIYMTSMKRMDYRNYQRMLIEEVMKEILPSDVNSDVDDVLESDKEFYEKWREIEEIMQDHYNKLSSEEKRELEEESEGLMEDFQKRISKEMEKTIIHKIGIDGMDVEYKGKGEVPGYVLNQFSMDEHEGYFRVATTTGNWRTEDYNHMYVLDEDLEIVGKIEDLAEGERIKSVRFMGDRAYMVTFVQIDPLFVIDLSEPTNPEVLGELKVTGYSSYLHPYDEDHLIGIGKETEEGKWGPIETGVKLSLFDVSDVSNPEQISKHVIEGGWTYTPVMDDHKAFLFDKEKNLLVIPARVNSQIAGVYTSWQGAYVFDLTLEDGFELKGTIGHEEKETGEDDYYVWRNYNNYVKRSLYIDDVLYTVSNSLVKFNELDDLDLINQVDIG